MSENNFTVLVAEDDEINFYLIEMWMQDLCTIIHAADGIKAVEKFKVHPEIDIIIMDIRMPYMNGIDATKEIRQLNKSIPIIAYTAYVMNDEVDLMQDAGCNEIMTKPSKKEDFSELVQKYKKIRGLDIS